MSTSDQRLLISSALGIAAMVLIALAAQDMWVTVAAIIVCTLQVIAVGIRVWQINRDEKSRAAAEAGEVDTAAVAAGEVGVAGVAVVGEVANAAEDEVVLAVEDEGEVVLAVVAEDGDEVVYEAEAVVEGPGLFEIAMAAAAEYSTVGSPAPEVPEIPVVAKGLAVPVIPALAESPEPGVSPELAESPSPTDEEPVEAPNPPESPEPREAPEPAESPDPTEAPDAAAPAADSDTRIVTKSVPSLPPIRIVTRGTAGTDGD